MGQALDLNCSMFGIHKSWTSLSSKQPHTDWAVIPGPAPGSSSLSHTRGSRPCGGGMDSETWTKQRSWSVARTKFQRTFVQTLNYHREHTTICLKSHRCVVCLLFSILPKRVQHLLKTYRKWSVPLSLPTRITPFSCLSDSGSSYWQTLKGESTLPPSRPHYVTFLYTPELGFKILLITSKLSMASIHPSPIYTTDPLRAAWGVEPVPADMGWEEGGTSWIVCYSITGPSLLVTAQSPFMARSDLGLDKGGGGGVASPLLSSLLHTYKKKKNYRLLSFVIPSCLSWLLSFCFKYWFIAEYYAFL